MIRAVGALALLAVALQLAACSSTASPISSPAAPPASTSTSPTSSSSAPTSAAATSATAPAATTRAATTPAATATATASAGGASPAAEVCTYLEGQVPALEAIGTPVGAHANLVANLFTFFQDHGIVPDSVALDEATTTQCPQVRSKVLAVTGLTSFSQL